ncbi:gliding motility-associated C-terminal domain-containing protein [Chondrinema litorale]|uniref:T9SS type B sorting domain-containing protein n=1 Tax=Chondrinema litorale TaxID=2994555 RepID=UPI002543BE34|nr:gliding motility-associated C-terminal domain-containing protein [Chondrinema litorale]UZR97994.1 PKD domain-containing protein [Chondrinema litorale]
MRYKILSNLIFTICIFFYGTSFGQLTTPFPVACYNFDGNLENDDPAAGIHDLEELGDLGNYISGDGVCYGTDSIYIFSNGSGLNLKKNNLPTDTYSLQLFFQFTSASNSPSGRRRILRFKSSTDAGLYLDSDNRLVFQTKNSSAAANLVKGTTVISEVNNVTEWINIAITRNDATSEMIVYLNGQEEMRLSTAGFSNLDNDFQLFEDGPAGTPNEEASGKIDFLRFYDEAMDATQIEEIYNISQIKNDVLISDNPGSTICVGETVELTASGGDGTYLWSTGETTTSIFVAPTDTTIYWVQSTTGTPCDRRCYNIRDSLTINVNPLPTADFTLTGGTCAGGTITLQYTGTTPLTANFNWNNFGGADDVNPLGNETYELIWNSTGVKTINLDVTQSGCTTSTSQNIAITEQVVASFNAPTSVCFPNQATISYSGTGTPTWDFGGGTANKQTGENYLVSWGSVGTYTISVSVEENGCLSEFSQDIEVYNPVAIFSADLNVCGTTETSLIQFTGSAGENATFNWSFDGGSQTKVSEDEEIYEVSWNTIGTKTVTLQIEDGGCISNTYSRQINVWPIPTADFSIPTEVCTPTEAIVQYTGTAANSATYNWDWDGGIASKTGTGETYSVYWAEPGEKTVRLTVSENNCLSEEVAQTILVKETPLATFLMPSTACQYSEVAIGYAELISSGLTFNWSFDGGAVISEDLDNQQYIISWDTEGTKTVTLDVELDGCSAQLVREIEIQSTPTAVINAPVGGCATDNILIEYGGDGLLSTTTFNWDFDGGTAVRTPGTQEYAVTWPDGGFKQVTLQTINKITGCSAVDTVIVQVNNFSAFDLQADLSTVCNPGFATIEFTGSLEDGATLIWDFDGGVAVKDGTSEKYTVTWDTSGEKTISVIAQGVLCPSDTAFQVIDVAVTPIAAFELPSSLVCRFDANLVTFTGTANDDADFYWDWDGGDATKISDTEYLVVWTESGVKDISLYIEQDGCISETVTQSITVNNESDFLLETINQGCLDEFVRITFTGVAEPEANLIWDFGGGTFELTGTDTYEGYWADAGTKEINLIVEGVVCPNDTTSKSIQIGEVPVISFEVSEPVCTTQPASIAFTGTVIDGQVITWDFADATQVDSIAVNTYQMIWETAGDKDINVTVNNNGCITDTVLQVTVNPLPVAAFIVPVYACLNESILLQFDGSIAGAADFDWDFGDAEIINSLGNEAISLRWTTAGTKYISLQIEENGCVSEVFTDSIFVTDPDGFDILAAKDILCEDEVVTISFDGYVEPGASINWNFDTDANITKTPGKHEYEISWPDPGTKTVTLDIISSCGTISENRDFQINELPVATFDLDAKACVGESANVTFTGTHDATWDFIWDFDGGTATVAASSATGEDYNVVWAEGGTKEVTLMIDNGGCITPIYSATIQVASEASFTLTPNKNTFCEGEVVLVQFNGSKEDGAVLTWDWDGGIPSGNLGNDSYEVYWLDAGEKNIELTIGGGTCPDVTFTETVQVLEEPVPDFTVSPAACLGEPVEITFTGQAEAGSIYMWDFGTAANVVKEPSLETYYVTWTETGSQRITLQIDNGGCLSEINSEGTYIMDFSGFDSKMDTVCAEQPLTIDLGIRDNIPGITYTWDYDGGEAITEDGLNASEVTWDTPGDKEVWLHINGLECSADSFVYYVHVKETYTPEIAITADSLYCDAREVLIAPVYNNGGENPTFRWFVNDRMVKTSETFSSSDLENGDEVFVIFSSSEECLRAPSVASNTIIINISDFAFQGDLTITPNPVCPGQPIDLSVPDIYAGVQWQSSIDGEEWESIDGGNVASLSVTPPEETFYRVWVTDGFCNDTSSAEFVEFRDVTPIEAAEDRTIREGYSTELGVKFGTDYTWSPADTTISNPNISNPVVSPVVTTTYYVTGTTIEGCLSTDSIVVTVTPRLFVPNTFTPNNDQINDYWEIDMMDEYPRAVVTVFNRWGKKIYQSEPGYLNPWNGFYKDGNEMPVSTYYYVLDLKDGFPAYKGSITIIR